MPRKNPLEDARKRLKEKVDSIKEQTDYITQTLASTVSKATNPATELLNLKDRKKFFQKYSKVSQELEKCLDFLLVLSDSVEAQSEDEGTDEQDSNDDDEDSTDKPDAVAKEEKKTEKKSKDEKPESKDIQPKPASNEHGTKVGLSAESTALKTTSEPTAVNTTSETSALQTTSEPTTLNTTSETSALNATSEPTVLQTISESTALQTTSESIALKTTSESRALNTTPESTALNTTSESIAPKTTLSTTSESSSETESQKNEKSDKKNALVNTCEAPVNSCAEPDSKKDRKTNETKKDYSRQQMEKQEGNNKTATVSHKQGSLSDSNVPSQLKMPQSYSKKDVQSKRKGSEGRRSPSVGLERTGRKSPSVGLERTGRKSPFTKGKEKRADTTATTKKNSLPNKAIQLNPYPFKNGQCLEVVVTEVLSPWELWIQPTGNGFNLLMETMCMHFAKAAASGYKGGLPAPPAVGEFCCARFLDDDTWYRVRVIGVYQSDDAVKQNQAHRQRLSSSGSVSSVDSNQAGIEVEVLCVDDGNREKLPLSRLRPLEESIAVLPCQALCCALSGVQPLVKNTVKSQGDSLWREESIEWLRNKVAGVKLLAYPKRTEDESLIMIDLFLENTKMKGPGREGAIPGKDSTLPGLQFSIAHIMVSQGFAQYVGPVKKPSNSKVSSPRSATSSERRFSSSSSVSLTSLKDCAMPVFDENALQSKVAQEDLDARKSVSGDGDVEHRDCTTEIMQHPKTTRDSNHPPNIDIQSEIPSQTLDHDCHKVPDVVQSRECLSGEAVPQDDDSHSIRDSPRHPPEGSSLTDSIHDGQDDFPNTQPIQNELTNIFLPTQDQPVFLQVMMSEVVTPSEFYVHLVTPEAVLLAELTEDLQAHYKGTDVTSTPVDYCLSIGDYCSAKFTQDDMWCRAKVLDVKVAPSGEGDDPFDHKLSANIHVFYLDYGNCEWISMDNTRPLLPKFMLLPGFAVRCRLAGVQPIVNQDDDNILVSNDLTRESSSDINSSNTDQQGNTISPKTDNQSDDTVSETSKLNAKNTDPAPSCKSPRRSPIGRGGKKKKLKKLPINKDVILRAAGDESGDSELSDGGLIFDFSTSKSEEKEKVKLDDKTTEDSALPERYLLPSPTKTPSSDITTEDKCVNPITRREWTEEAIELFKGLTDDDKPLRGIMVPWNARIYQHVFYPTTGNTHVDITYQRPTLVLQLYDTTGEEDIDIVQIMVETGLAELCDDDQNLILEDIMDQDFTTKTLHLTVADLETTAAIFEQEGTCTSLLSISPDGEDDEAMMFWNPMMDDFKSSRNAYKIDTNDLDIAIHGFKPIETQYCRFFRNPNTRCWRGDNCPMLHAKEGEDASVRVQAFCNNNDFTVDLPKLDSWVGVRVTAVLNPGHFWVQFPCGSGPIEKKIMEERLGLTNNEAKNDDDENFEGMMERMNKFYKKNLFRDSTTILPAVGELIVAKYSQNDQWYRACVIDVVDNNFKVSFVDFGNSEWTAESNVKRMLPQFLHLPFQAVECFLGNVEPVDEWSPVSMAMFESLTQDKLLIAHVLAISANNTMYVEMFDTQREHEININEELIKEGFAIESSFKITPPTRSTGPGSTSSGGGVSPESSDCEIIEIPG